jgi:hypothetical protein
MTCPPQVVFDSENVRPLVPHRRSLIVGVAAAVSHGFTPFHVRFASVFQPFFSRFLPVFYRLFSPSLSEEFFDAAHENKDTNRSHRH